MQNKDYAKSNDTSRKLPFDWTKISENPNSETARKAYITHMKSIRKSYDDLDTLLLSFCADKRVLDIGIAQHTVEATERESWRHGKNVKVAQHTLGIDVNEKIIDILSKKGYNVSVVDATSEGYIGENFDVVFMGDVIEHVNSPYALLQFSKRHLSPDGNGSIIVSTPNPLFINSALQSVKNSTATPNFEHTCFIVPANINELCRRSGLRLLHYYVRGDRAVDNLVNRVLKKILPLGELYTSTFVYEIGVG